MAEHLPSTESLEAFLLVLRSKEEYLRMKQGVPRSLLVALGNLIDAIESVNEFMPDVAAERIQFARERLRMEIDTTSRQMFGAGTMK